MIRDNSVQQVSRSEYIMPGSADFSGCVIILIQMGDTIHDVCVHLGGDEDSNMYLIKADSTSALDWFMSHASSVHQVFGELFVDNVLEKGDRYAEKD